MFTMLERWNAFLKKCTKRTSVPFYIPRTYLFGCYPRKSQQKNHDKTKNWYRTTNIKLPVSIARCFSVNRSHVPFFRAETGRAMCKARRANWDWLAVALLNRAPATGAPSAWETFDVAGVIATSIATPTSPHHPSKATPGTGKNKPPAPAKSTHVTRQAKG